MKTGWLKIHSSGNKNWLPLLLFTLGFGIQIAGKWLPTLIVCYKAQRMPRIELWQDGCDCRKACAERSLAGHHEDSVSFHDACLDVPLVAGPGCAPLPDLFNFKGSRYPGARGWLSPTPAPFLYSLRPQSGCSPPLIEITNFACAQLPFPGAVDSFFCRRLC